MREWMFLLLGVTACGKSAASALPGDVANEAAAMPVPVTNAERQRMERSVNAWVKSTMDAWMQGDSVALMNTYEPSGPLVSAADGELYTSRDSVANFLTGIGQTTDKKATWKEPKIDVVAPGVVAVTLAFQMDGKSNGKKPFHNTGVYSAVLAERDGHLVIVQEHQSLPPSKK